VDGRGGVSAAPSGAGLLSLDRSRTAHQNATDTPRQAANIRNIQRWSCSASDSFSRPGTIRAGSTRLELKTPMLTPISRESTDSEKIAKTIEISDDQPMPHSSMPR
jgi:hypothetical protein